VTKIKQETVDAIRAEFAAGMTQAAIARKYNVSPAAVCRIVNGSRHKNKEAANAATTQ
jgi:DNA-binding transcriptional regulator LsrR (DeoR family)